MDGISNSEPDSEGFCKLERLTQKDTLLNEQDLVISLRKAEPKAFKYLVDTWQNMVFNTVLGIVQDETEAEDLSQEVFIQVFRSIGDFKGESRLSTWLYRIAVTKALDAERKKKTKKRFSGLLSFFGGTETQDPGHFHHPGILVENKEKAALLFKAVNGLPKNQRIAFILIRTEGLSYEETAGIMEVTVKSVEALMQRAKENLRKELKTYYQS